MDLAKELAVWRGVGGVLLDFDGPVADLFPSGSGSRIAAETRAPIVQAGVEIPEPVASTREHLMVLEFAAVHARMALDAAEELAVVGEIACARVAPITAGVVEFLRACAEAGLPVAIVSNNAGPAIEVFLERFALVDQVAAICGRPFARPELMKPHPALVEQALEALKKDAGECVLIGDSVTDIEVSRLAGVRSIGYAKNPQRGEELGEAGADALTDSMGALADVVRELGSVPLAE